MLTLSKQRLEGVHSFSLYSENTVLVKKYIEMTIDNYMIKKNIFIELSHN